LLEEGQAAWLALFRCFTCGYAVYPSPASDGHTAPLDALASCMLTSKLLMGAYVFACAVNKNVKRCHDYQLASWGPNLYRSTSKLFRRQRI